MCEDNPEHPIDSFKPYYKWITFNIIESYANFIISAFIVLNLIINGLLSILSNSAFKSKTIDRFKPYYKWITFNI